MGKNVWFAFFYDRSIHCEAYNHTDQRVDGRLQSIQNTLMGILVALPPTADADDSIQLRHISPLSFAHAPLDSPSLVPTTDAVDTVNATSDQQVKAGNIRVLFSAFPEILQHLIDAAWVVDTVLKPLFSAFLEILLHLVDAASAIYALLKDCDVCSTIAMPVVVAIFFFILYDVCIRYDTILVQ